MKNHPPSKGSTAPARGQTLSWPVTLVSPRIVVLFHEHAEARFVVRRHRRHGQLREIRRGP